MRTGSLRLIVCWGVVAILVAAAGAKTIAFWCSHEPVPDSRIVAKALAAQKLKYSVTPQTIYKDLTLGSFWFHPYLAAIPNAGKDGQPAVILLTQRHLIEGDHYLGTSVMRTDDLGNTWSGPTAVEALASMPQGGELDLAVSGVVPKWHPQTKRILAIGHSVLHDHRTGHISKPGGEWAFYTTYDPKTDQWTRWAALGEPGRDYYTLATGSDQWRVEPDGSILLPVYFQQSKGSTWVVEVWKCRFDGQRLEVVSKGNRLERYMGYGIVEPSLAKFAGRYWLTLRSQDTALVTTSKDGLRYEPLTQWRFDDGEVLGSHNTQQHWAAHSNGLFLVYTRRGANNDDVYDHRAPLFIAQVDPDRKVVLRKTERMLLPDRGVALGNFGVSKVTPDETWVSTSEEMLLADGKLPTQRGAEGATMLARIRWSKPNRSE